MRIFGENGFSIGPSILDLFNFYIYTEQFVQVMLWASHFLCRFYDDIKMHNNCVDAKNQYENI